MTQGVSSAPGSVRRRTVLRVAGAVVALPAVPSLAGCDSSGTGDPTSPVRDEAILDLRFRPAEQYRPFSLVAPGFAQLDEGIGRIAGLRRTDAIPAAPFVAVDLRVDAATADGVAAGLSTPGGDTVLATYRPDSGTVAIEVTSGGASQLVAEVTARLDRGYGFAFVLCENQVTALVDTGGGWQPVVTERDAVSALVDLRDPATLATYACSLGTATGAGEVALDRAVAGPFGYAGLRDPHLVQQADGTPVVRDGLAYLTFTCAGMGFFQQAHWGVFTLDLADPTRLEQVAQLYSRRDGLLLGDHAGQLVLTGDGVTVAGLSSWGDFDGDGVHARWAQTTDDLLAGVHLLETEPLALPTDVSSWDPSFTTIDDRWYVGFVESPSQDPFEFHPALAVGPPGSGPSEDLELVGVDDSTAQGEGTILASVDGQQFLLASDKDTESYPVYDLDMRRLGSLDAPYVASNIPHPQLVPLPDGGYLLVTFDGTQYAEDVLGYGGHGDVVVMRST